MASTERHPQNLELERRPTQDQLILNFDRLLRDNRGGKIDNPIRYIPDDRLREYLEPLRDNCGDAVTMDDLERGAKLAKIEHALDLGMKTPLLTNSERESLKIQRSPAFWREPKDLQITLAVCCMAAMVQGWDQVANGNSGWPRALHKVEDPYEKNNDNTLIFAAVQAIPWFSASILGSYLSDPLSEYVGRRKALFVAGFCSLSASVAGSRVESWQALLGTRVILGLGIGGKASIVPVLMSEILPSSKRGRLLVSWQAFTATGLAAGSIVCYIFRDNWRNQYLSGAIPAFSLLISAFAACESPRWLIIQNQYPKAFNTLVRLRKDNVLAAKELVSIHYQIQAERSVFLRRPADPESSGLDPFQRRLGRSTYWERLYNMVWFPRIRRAAIAAMVVMLAQQMSGINIYAFMSTQFYGNFGPYERRAAQSGEQSSEDQTPDESFIFAIGFGLANMVFSIVAFFLVENKDSTFDSSSDDRADRSSSASVSSVQSDDLPQRIQLRGRRFLLLTSLAAGVVTLLLTANMFSLPPENDARKPMIIFFIMLFTAFYSPGAGAIPFLYCAEIFPNEGRELGMSWSTFWNFLGAGVLAISVPFLMRWGLGQLLGLFSGFNAIAFVLVWFFVPGTNHTATLEDMSYVFGRRMRDHASIQAKRLLPGSNFRGPDLQWPSEHWDGAENGQAHASGRVPVGSQAGEADEPDQNMRQLPMPVQVSGLDGYALG